MKGSDAEWHCVAKKLMYDFHVLNAEICDLPSDHDDEDVKVALDNESVSSQLYLSSTDKKSSEWMKSTYLDFDINELDIDLLL